MLVFALGAALASRLDRPSVAEGPCAVTNGPLALAGVPEASGLALSRRHPGVIWAHNDSGNEPVLFAFAAHDGTPRGRIRVPVGMRDWEDISAAPCPLGDCLYLGDIGDNRAVRPQVSIYRIAEPALGDQQTAMPERLRATYADGPHNAESMFVVGSDLFIVTRDRTGGLYRSAIAEDADHEMTLQRVGELGVAAATDAELSRSGLLVVVRTPREALFYRTADLTAGRGCTPWRHPSVKTAN
jgi:hypothetical protein